jgi:aminomethyltransferase
MIEIKFSEIGSEFEISTNNVKCNCKIVEKPFFDPKKNKVSIKSI